MSRSNSIDQSLNKNCDYDDNCAQMVTSDEEEHDGKNALDHQTNFAEDLEHLLEWKEILENKLKLFILELSVDDLLNRIRPIYAFKITSDKFDRRAQTIQKYLENVQQRSKVMTHTVESNENDYLENEFKHLRRNIEILQSKLDQINDDYEKRAIEDEAPVVDLNVSLDDDRNKIIEQQPSSRDSSKRKCQFRSGDATLKNGSLDESNESSIFSRLLLQQISPTILDVNHDELVRNAINKNQSIDGDEAETVIIPSTEMSQKISQKVHPSNNIIRLVRGPFKNLIIQSMQAIDRCTEEVRTNDVTAQIVKQRIAEQRQTSDSPLKAAYAQIASDWKFEEENHDPGLSSQSIWMKNSQGQRVLIKSEDHPMLAANEWLAYVLGRTMGLPVNEVQISIYEDKLVTIHTDVAQENEKTITYMDLPRRLRKLVFLEPIVESMQLFDVITQEVDRNQRNILITIPKTSDINDQTLRMKIHFVDHGASFGMHKFNALSIVAAKFRCHRLGVIAFNPSHEAKKFEGYLNKVPIGDRPLIANTLNRFAAISDEQFHCWMTQVQDLFGSKQYTRISDVLRRKRDIAKRYTIQWGIDHKTSTVTSDTIDENLVHINEPIVFF